MTIGLIIHWIAAALLILTASFALIEVKSSSLIPRSLFLWPLSAFIFGALTLLSSFMMPPRSHWNSVIFLVLGFVMIVASLQAFLVNIRKISRWPSGIIWLGLIVVGILYQIPYAVTTQEPLFQNFIHRLSGLLWATIGITKIIGEQTVSEGNRVPVWITLTYIQAILIASLPH